MCLFLNVSYRDMLLLAKIKNIIGNIKCLRKIYYSFIIILILQHYFRVGERQLWGSLNTPKSLMTLMTEFRYWKMKMTDNEFDTS